MMLVASFQAVEGEESAKMCLLQQKKKTNKKKKNNGEPS